MLELQVVVGSDRFGPGSQHRVFGDVVDALTGEPDLPVGVPQALEVGLTSTCSHDAFPFVCRGVSAWYLATRMPMRCWFRRVALGIRRR